MAQAVSTAPDAASAEQDVAFAPWSCCAQPPGAITHPSRLQAATSGWLSAPVPGTVAAALAAGGRWDFNRPVDLDAEDWWYRTTFPTPDLPPGQPCHLCFDGLATLAEVWLNGERLLTTDNMFRRYHVEVGRRLHRENELVLGFRSLAEALKCKRPRPRWKTRLVSHQQLRWYRTTLLGRIPGWSPPAAPVGPWRAVRLDTRPFSLAELRLNSRLEGDEGVVSLLARLHSHIPVLAARLRVGGQESQAAVGADGDGWRVAAELRVPRPPLWWPHTHGGQHLHACFLHLRTGAGEYAVPCGGVGFRRLTVQQDRGLAVEVNGVPVYCRGACWTASDALTLSGSAGSLAHDLRLAREAGANIMRVGGTGAYESDDFYRLCDELGILVWQDFPFANMDYPVEDPDFAANIEAEANEQLARLAPHPCVAVLCGNSEVEQQAAMFGAPREVWRNRWFADRLPALCAEYIPDAAYVPSTPSGGALPFHVREGVGHYYGVGAYGRSPQDLRKDDVRFASECLAFANVPDAATVSAVMGGAAPAVHHPLWKQRVPRDSGAGWDFDDVRDRYLQHLFAVHPLRLRSCDMERYLQLSRVVPGELMAQTFAEWRGSHSRSRGGLVWFYKDLWPAPGWGILDSFGRPKAAYYYLRRSWLPLQLTLTDEGLDGLHLHLINETPDPFNGHVELLLLKEGRVIVARAEVPCELPSRARRTLDADALLDGFRDVTYSYRFGPPGHDLAVATLLDDQRRVLSEAFYFVQPREPSFLPAVQLDVEAEPVGEGSYRVSLRCDHFLQGVSFDAEGFLPDDNYFHLPPSRQKQVHFRPLRGPRAPFRAHLEALNLRAALPIRLKETSR